MDGEAVLQRRFPVPVYPETTMADFFTTVRHEVEVGCDQQECGYSGHGHRMRIEVSVKGTYDAARGSSVAIKELEMALEVVLSEVHLKPLNVIAPAQPTPEGLGLWIIERMLGQWPKIVEVRVWRDRQVSFSIRREPR